MSLFHWIFKSPDYPCEMDLFVLKAQALPWAWREREPKAGSTGLCLQSECHGAALSLRVVLLKVANER